MSSLATLDDAVSQLRGQLAALNGIPLQTGTGTLVNGVSAAISARLTATSRIHVTPKDIAASTALGVLGATSAGRTTGGSGSFVVTSQKTDASGTQTGDQSTFDWLVIG